MIIDAHVHILPDRVRDNLGMVASTEPWFAACHARGQRVASAKSLLAAMDDQGVDRAVCFSWPFAQPSMCAEANDYIAAVVKRFPIGWRALGSSSPWTPERRAR